LTTTQVRAAEQGATNILKSASMRQRAWGPISPKLKADINAAVNGEYALTSAPSQDPDTHYQDLTGVQGGSSVPMRQLAAQVASNVGAGGGCSTAAQNVETALNGLPR
jgi:hypothetical protein